MEIKNEKQADEALSAVARWLQSGSDPARDRWSKGHFILPEHNKAYSYIQALVVAVDVSPGAIGISLMQDHDKWRA